MGTGWSQDEDLSDQSEPNKEESKNSKNQTLGNPVCNFASKTNSKNGNNKAMEAEKTVPEAIHNLDSIIKDADSAIDRFSEEKLSTRLQHGITLNQNKQASLVISLTNFKPCLLSLCLSNFLINNITLDLTLAEILG